MSFQLQTNNNKRQQTTREGPNPLEMLRKERTGEAPIGTSREDFKKSVSEASQVESETQWDTR